MVERKKFIANSEQYFHLLRHFICISAEEKFFLIDKGYSDLQIEEQLHVPGSKFFSSFVEGPLALIDRLNSIPETYSFFQDKETIVFLWDMKMVNAENSIGTDGIVCLDNLDSIEKQKIYLSKRGSFDAQFYPSIIYPSTTKIVLVAKVLDQGFVLKTCFPGIYAPPFPATWMDFETNEKAEKFWNKHAFIVSSHN